MMTCLTNTDQKTRMMNETQPWTKIMSVMNHTIETLTMKDSSKDRRFLFAKNVITVNIATTWEREVLGMSAPSIGIGMSVLLNVMVLLTSDRMILNLRNRYMYFSDPDDEPCYAYDYMNMPLKTMNISNPSYDY